MLLIVDELLKCLPELPTLPVAESVMVPHPELDSAAKTGSVCKSLGYFAPLCLHILHAFIHICLNNRLRKSVTVVSMETQHPPTGNMSNVSSDATLAGADERNQTEPD